VKNKKNSVIHFGPVRVTVKRSGLVLVGLPCEKDGWADHATFRPPPDIPNVPDDIPRDHDFEPHLTRRYPGKSKARREEINGGSLTGAELLDMVREFQHAVMPRWLEYTRPAILELFDLAGYLVLPDQSPELNGLFDAAFRCFQPAADQVECGIPNMDDLLLLAEEATATQIEQAMLPTELQGQSEVRYALVRTADGEIEMIGHLAYFPRGLPTGAWVPGWYLTHVNWMTPEFAKESMKPFTGGKLMGMFEQIAKAFGYSEAEAEAADP
jgi:hypothetical protein